jgi:hypothetical protein
MSDIPAVQAEAEDATTITVDWLGVPVVLPAKPDDWDLDAMEAFEQGKAVTAVRGVLGKGYESTVEAFKKTHGRKPQVRDLESLMQGFAEAYGFESPGE